MAKSKSKSRHGNVKTGKATVSTVIADPILAPPIVNSALPNIPGGEDHLLPYDIWLNPLPVQFELWMNSGPTPARPEFLYFYWDKQLVMEKTFTAPITPAELIIQTPVSFLTEGEHELTYSVTLGTGASDSSFAQIVTIDKTAPVLDRPSFGKLEFPPEVITDGITDHYLTQNSEEVLAKVPLYLTDKLADEITWYWSKTANGSDIIAGTRVLKQGETQPFFLSFKGAMIRGDGDGQRFATYVVQDRAGNSSGPALAAELKVAAAPVPRNFGPPKVLEAQGSSSASVLLPAAAVAGVTVQVPADAVFYADETVWVQWGEEGGFGSTRTETQIVAGKREGLITSGYIWQHIDSRMPVSYVAIDGSGRSEPSRSHNLTVSMILGVPTIQCDKVSSGVLSLASVPAGGFANFTIGVWMFINTGQFVKVWLDVTNLQGERVDIPVLTDVPVPGTVAPISVGRVSKADLQRCKLNSTIWMNFEVSFDNKQTWKQFLPVSVNLVA